MALFGPLFKSGDKVDWVDPSCSLARDYGYRSGPFTVLAVENKIFSATFMRRKSHKAKAVRERLIGIGNHSDEPAQWITIETLSGKLIRDENGKPAKFASAYFKKME